MKKLLLLLVLTGLMTVNVVQANEDSSKVSVDFKRPPHEVRQHRENAFEKRLGLTEEQKAKAREIRKKGHEKMEPVITEIRKKKQEIKTIKMSRMAVQMQEELLTEIDKKMKVLEKKAHDIKNQNMKEFEAILTRQQKKILKQMKKEGRKKYHAQHPAQMQFKMQAPNFNKK